MSGRPSDNVVLSSILVGWFLNSPMHRELTGSDECKVDDGKCLHI